VLGRLRRGAAALGRRGGTAEGTGRRRGGADRETALPGVPSRRRAEVADGEASRRIADGPAASGPERWGGSTPGKSRGMGRPAPRYGLPNGEEF
jgi:hypothetical protein